MMCAGCACCWARDILVCSKRARRACSEWPHVARDALALACCRCADAIWRTGQACGNVAVALPRFVCVHRARITDGILRPIARVAGAVLYRRGANRAARVCRASELSRRGAVSFAIVARITLAAARPTALTWRAAEVTRIARELRRRRGARDTIRADSAGALNSAVRMCRTGCKRTSHDKSNSEAY